MRRAPVTYKDVYREYRLLFHLIQEVLGWDPWPWEPWIAVINGEYRVGRRLIDKSTGDVSYLFDVPIANHLDITAVRNHADGWNGYVGKGHREVLRFFQGANQALRHFEDAKMIVGNHER